jgi:hypothetical protein
VPVYPETFREWLGVLVEDLPVFLVALGGGERPYSAYRKKNSTNRVKKLLARTVYGGD